jgi:hypothetical protein
MSAMRQRCSHCHQWIEAENRFCPHCGARLSDPETAGLRLRREQVGDVGDATRLLGKLLRGVGILIAIGFALLPLLVILFFLHALSRCVWQ